jgi:hypothetical protein
MFGLIKMILNGITSTTSTEYSGEKEEKMINFTTSNQELDIENDKLFKASAILESLGNQPGATANEFYASLLASEHPVEEHEGLTLAAVAIETMMNIDVNIDVSEEPTVH